MFNELIMEGLLNGLRGLGLVLEIQNIQYVASARDMGMERIHSQPIEFAQ